MPRPTTLEDIARACDVSRRVVSAVLNPGPTNRQVRCSDDTRRRVMREAQRLDYRPNRISRSMKENRHGQIGILMRNVHAVHPNAIPPLLYRAQQLGLSVVTQLHPEGEAELPRFVREHMVDGIIVFEDFERPLIAAIDRYQIPLVMVNSFRRRRPGLVAFDERGAIQQIVAAFAAAGRRRIQMFVDGFEPRHSRHRISALRSACRQAGLSPPRLTSIGVRGVGDGVHVDYGQLIIPETHAALTEGCDAFYLQFDFWAFAVYQALERAGLAIPRDVSVAAHHLVMPSAFQPALGGFAIPLDQGIIAVDLLEALIDGRNQDTAARSVAYRFRPGASIGEAEPSPDPSPDPVTRDST